MPGQDDEDAGSRGRRGDRLRRPRRARDAAVPDARLAPLEETMPTWTGGNGAGPDDTIRVEANDLKPAGDLLDGEEDEHGVFYLPPVVRVAVSLFLAYTLFVAALIALG